MAKYTRVINMSEDEYTEHTEAMDGVCLACGEYSDSSVEPDARNYKCGSCNARAVCGVEWALVSGNIELV